uniref:Uncharacterized protein n=1 Tax=Globodera rostochiensis TaxID=31243 RepID=A0A914HIN8_GLORO
MHQDLLDRVDFLVSNNMSSGHYGSGHCRVFAFNHSVGQFCLLMKAMTSETTQDNGNGRYHRGIFGPMLM